MDVHTKEQRSFNMSQVKSKNTKPEILMFSLLNEAGYKFKKHYSVIGKPDIAFPQYKVAIFIDGEFWHGRNFIQNKKALSPFWVKKIGDNLKRDRKNTRELRVAGWQVLHLWDKSIIKNPEQSLEKVVKFLECSKTSGVK
jgi:DNA mismatch endonuclease (patch repair protein)